MHELSLIEAVLEQVRRATPPGLSVRTVHLRIGKLRQAVPEMLTFGYAAAVNDGSRLEIEEVSAQAQCRACAHTFVVDENWFECPRCHSVSAHLLQGDELVLTSLDLAESPQPCECV
ncbi:MAG: hydrogenase nickel incorporation protein HypA [Verrucomicrobiae bacterium]|nr:hydrogenase nickel incorporation protein HypA [Verrucomicrobiae bacterium]